MRAGLPDTTFHSSPFPTRTNRIRDASARFTVSADMRDRFARGDTFFLSTGNRLDRAGPEALSDIEADSRRTINYIGCGADCGKEKVSVICEGKAVRPVPLASRLARL